MPAQKISSIYKFCKLQDIKKNKLYNKVLEEFLN